MIEVLEAVPTEVGGAPWGVAVDDGAVWVSDAARGAVIRLDPKGGVVAELATGAPDPREAGLTVVDGQLWIANLGGTVGVIDIATGAPLMRVDLAPGEPAAVAEGSGGAMWVPLHGPGGGLARVDRGAPGASPKRTSLPESAFAVAVAGDLVWVAGLDRRVFAVDADSGAVERAIDLGGAPRGIAVAAGDIWVSLRDARSIVRIDGRTGAVVARIAVDGSPWPVAAGAGVVWVATLEGRLLRIDTDRNEVTGAASVGSEPRAIAVAPGAVWVASQSGVVSRVGLDAARSGTR